MQHFGHCLNKQWRHQNPLFIICSPSHTTMHPSSSVHDRANPRSQQMSLLRSKSAHFPKRPPRHQKPRQKQNCCNTTRALGNSYGHTVAGGMASACRASSAGRPVLRGLQRGQNASQCGWRPGLRRCRGLPARHCRPSRRGQAPDRRREVRSARSAHRRRRRRLKGQLVGKPSSARHRRGQLHSQAHKVRAPETCARRSKRS